MCSSDLTTIQFVAVTGGGAAGQTVRGPSLAMNFVQWKFKHIADINDICGGSGSLPPGKFPILETLREYFRHFYYANEVVTYSL